MFRFLLWSTALGAACSCLAASEKGLVRSFTDSDASNALRLTSGASSGAVDADSFAISEINFPMVRESLGNDLFEANQSASSQVFQKGHKVFGESGIVPLGDGQVFVASLGAVIDEERIAGSGNRRMPISKTMTLGIIAAILLVGVIIRKKSIAH